MSIWLPTNRYSTTNQSIVVMDVDNGPKTVCIRVLKQIAIAPRGDEQR
jgi:hypothetical protein